MSKQEKQIGDTLEVKVRRYKKLVVLTGVIKEKRENFGWTEYLVGDVKCEPFWVRAPRNEG